MLAFIMEELRGFTQSVMQASINFVQSKEFPCLEENLQCFKSVKLATMEVLAGFSDIFSFL